MKKNLLKLYIPLIFIFQSCDPGVTYFINGKVIDSLEHKPLDSVKIEYRFYPLENFHNWRTRITKDALVFTNKNGYFKFILPTLTMYFDSIKVFITKKGYHKRVITTLRKDWKKNWKMM